MRQALSSDEPLVVAALVSAFADDPVWSWIAPDPESRPRVHGHYFRPMVEAGIARETLWTTSGIEAVALFVPPGEAETLTPEGIEGPLALTSSHDPQHGAAVAELFDAMDEARPMSQPHYYLSVLGTHGSHRGSGLGMKLLRQSLARIDELQLPVYLESSNPANEPRYNAVGFEAIGQIETTTGAPPMTSMWREPEWPPTRADGEATPRLLKVVPK